MFYILAGHFLVTPTGKSKDIFKLFLYGTICYIILHIYLYRSEQNGFLDYIKSYIYYIQGFDFTLALARLKFFSEVKDDTSTDDHNNIERDAIMQKVQEARMAAVKQLEDKQFDKQSGEESDEKEVFVSRQDTSKTETDKNVLKSNVSTSNVLKSNVLKSNVPTSNVPTSNVQISNVPMCPKDSETKKSNDTELPIFAPDM